MWRRATLDRTSSARSQTRAAACFFATSSGATRFAPWRPMMTTSSPTLAAGTRASDRCAWYSSAGAPRRRTRSPRTSTSPQFRLVHAVAIADRQHADTHVRRDCEWHFGAGNSRRSLFPAPGSAGSSGCGTAGRLRRRGVQHERGKQRGARIDRVERHRSPREPQDLRAGQHLERHCDTAARATCSQTSTKRPYCHARHSAARPVAGTFGCALTYAQVEARAVRRRPG